MPAEQLKFIASCLQKKPFFISYTIAVPSLQDSEKLFQNIGLKKFSVNIGSILYGHEKKHRILTIEI